MTGELLPTWDQALDALDVDPDARPAHVMRFGAQLDMQGILRGHPEADRAIRYLTKYITKDVSSTADETTNAGHRRHADRMHTELRYQDVNLSRGSLHVRSSRLRPSYEHGCSPPCGKFAGWCPERRQVTPDRGETKSDAGHRIVGLPRELVQLLSDHRVQQQADREHARQLWRDEGWVFASAVGAAINPNTDCHRWKALLRKAGVRDARLHDARHTAATVLLVLGVPERAVMGIMGWSSTSMAARYQHVTDQIRGAVADQVGAAIWGGESGRSDGN